MTVGEALATGTQRLETAGVPDGQLDARLLLAHLLNKNHLELLALHRDLALEPDLLAQYDALLARRAAREPLQYILGVAHFMGHAFVVRPGVLIPRQDSEPLALLAIGDCQPGQLALDLCCGSGCLGISLQLACPESQVYAGDISPEAITLTRRNADSLGANLDIRQGDLFAPFAGLLFDSILCNPPYIPEGQMPLLQAEVGHEPALALAAGVDGLDFYRRVLQEAPGFLRPGGLLLLELGDGQAEAVSALVGPSFEYPRIHLDLAGLPRVLETRRRGGVH